MADDYINRVKEIPILDVCRFLGIEVQHKSGKYWCKLRPDERTASTILHTEKTPNSFYDFGNGGEHGDVIQFVAVRLGVDSSAALKLLADNFNISRDRNNLEMTDWEYEKIGLHGDMATKNFTFDFVNKSYDENIRISEKFQMSMNELRRRHTKTYEKLIYKHAIPFVRDLRNEYYADVFFTHQLLKSMGCAGDFSRFLAIKDQFDKEIRTLQNAERSLLKATVHTSIKAHPVGEYEPNRDLERILAGEVKLSLGSQSYNEMKTLAKEQDCNLKSQAVSIDKFSTDGLEDYSYSAFIKEGNVIIGYLESDFHALNPMLTSMCRKEELSKQISGAELRTIGQPDPIYQEQNNYER